MFIHPFADLLAVLTLALGLAILLDLIPGTDRLITALSRPTLRLLAALERKLNRPGRGKRTLRGRGVAVVLMLLLGTLALGIVLQWSARHLPRGVLLEILLMAALFSQAPLNATIRRLAADTNQPHHAPLLALAMPHLRPDARVDDRHGIARALLERLAEAPAAALVAPLLGYLLCGLPGALAARLFSAMARLWHMPDADPAFAASAIGAGAGIVRLPATIAATLLALAALVTPGARAGAAWRAWWLSARRVTAPVAVLAEALQLALGGPRLGGPIAQSAPWIGIGSARPTSLQMRLGLRLVTMSRLLAWLALALIWLL